MFHQINQSPPIYMFLIMCFIHPSISRRLRKCIMSCQGETLNGLRYIDPNLGGEHLDLRVDRIET